MSEHLSPEKSSDRVTMKQIANKAGVSVAAVSMALNNKKGVSKEKADDLRRIALEMGYITDDQSRSNRCSLNLIQPLTSKDHRNDLYEPLIVEFLQAIAYEAGNRDFALEIHSRETDNMGDLIDLIHSSNRDGSIIMAASLNQNDVETLAAVDTPIVFVEGFDHGIHADFVSLDNDNVVHDLLAYLLNKGHSRIGLVQDKSYSRNLDLREKAFFYYMDQTGLQFDQEWLFRLPADDDGPAAMQKLLASRKIQPSALLCVNDIMAYHSIQACQDLDISIPNDMAVVGFDDLPASRLIRPRLTTAKVPRALIARRCMQLLVDRIEMGPNKAPEHITVGGLIIRRESA